MSGLCRFRGVFEPKTTLFAKQLHLTYKFINCISRLSMIKLPSPGQQQSESQTQEPTREGCGVARFTAATAANQQEQQKQ